MFNCQFQCLLILSVAPLVIIFYFIFHFKQMQIFKLCRERTEVMGRMESQVEDRKRVKNHDGGLTTDRQGSLVLSIARCVVLVLLAAWRLRRSKAY